MMAIIYQEDEFGLNILIFSSNLRRNTGKTSSRKLIRSGIEPYHMQQKHMQKNMETEHLSGISAFHQRKKPFAIGGLQGISSLKAGGPHATQGQRGKVKTPLTNQAINHLAMSATVTHSGQKLAEFTSVCKLLCCYKIALPPSQHKRTCSNIERLWETVCLFLALAIQDWLLPRTPLHTRACRLPAVRIEIHYSKLKVDALTVQRRARRLSMLPFVRNFKLK